jgi:REP element-mobilizing transposase RayT
MAIGGVEDHVHVVVRFATTISIADLVKQLKGSSSRAVNRDCPEASGRFRWQGTYGVFAVERAGLDRVVRYVQRQCEHHRAGDVDALLETVRVAYTTPTYPPDGPSGDSRGVG